MCACVEEQEPGAGIAGEDGFDTLAIEPAGGFDGLGSTEGGDVRIDEAAEAVGYASSDARKTGAGRGEDDGGPGGAAEGFKGGGVGGVARLGKGLAGDGQQAGSGGGQGAGCGSGVDGDDADGERSA
jgi:hypothetical protein